MKTFGARRDYYMWGDWSNAMQLHRVWLATSRLKTTLLLSSTPPAIEIPEFPNVRPRPLSIVAQSADRIGGGEIWLALTEERHPTR